MERSGRHPAGGGHDEQDLHRRYERAINEKTGAHHEGPYEQLQDKGVRPRGHERGACRYRGEPSYPFLFRHGQRSFLRLRQLSPASASHRYRRRRESRRRLVLGRQASRRPSGRHFLGQRTVHRCHETNPLTQGPRPDKFTLAALEATLLLYLDTEKARREIPVLRMLHEDPAE